MKKEYEPKNANKKIDLEDKDYMIYELLTDILNELRKR